MGEILTGLMSLSHGLVAIGDEVPAVGSLLNSTTASLSGSAHLLPSFQKLTPSVQTLMKEVNPRIFSGLTLSDVADRLGPVIEGQEDLVSALNHIRQDASFRVIGDMPIKGLLGMLGISNDLSDVAEDESLAVS